MKRQLSAFTMIELLTVIAITAILLTLIIVPVVQSFTITRTAQAFADAQDKARIVTERIAREIGNTAGVRDLSGTQTWTVNGDQVQLARHTLAVTVPMVDADGNATSIPTWTQVLLPYSKIDLFLPAEGEESISGGALINPDTGMIDPTVKAPRGSVRLPAAPGQLWVRYFIGLNRPIRAEDGQLRANFYNDPYTGLLRTRTGERDNLYVLYRAEFVPRNAAGWNASLFELDANGAAILDDPAFFSFTPDDISDTATGALTASGQAKALRMMSWMGLDSLGGVNNPAPRNSHATSAIITEVSRYDMIQPLYDRRTRQVQNNGGVPKLIPLVQFRPTRIENDPAEPQAAVRLGDETQNAGSLGADVFTSRFGLWSGAVVKVWPTGFNPNDATANQYVVGRQYPGGFGIYAIDPDDAANDDERTEGVPLFNQTAYENAPKFPFSAAVETANLNSEPIRNVFVPFFTIPSRGKVIASFSVSEVGDPTGAGTEPNLPAVQSGAALSPLQENPASAPYSPYPNVASFGINQVFNRLWNEYPQLQGTIHRFIDARVVPTLDGTYTPLFPNYIGGATGFARVNPLGTRSSRVFIVPGSEEVWGPDQLPGPNLGSEVRYARVNGTPGPNQYRINYTDLAEPTDDGGRVDYSIAFPGAQSTPPDSYTPDNLVSAVLQPRFRAGYIQLNSDPNIPLPQGMFRVSYRFQFIGGRRGNQPGERLAVDYDTRNLISVLLTIRNYPQSSAPNPQSVTLKATATVRNYVR